MQQHSNKQLLMINKKYSRADNKGYMLNPFAGYNNEIVYKRKKLDQGNVRYDRIINALTRCVHKKNLSSQHCFIITYC